MRGDCPLGSGYALVSAARRPALVVIHLPLAGGLPVVASASDGVADAAQEPQDGADHDQDDADRPQDRDAEYEADDQADGAQNDHGGLLCEWMLLPVLTDRIRWRAGD